MNKRSKHGFVRLALFLGVLAMIALAGAACGDDDGDTEPTATPRPVATDPPPPPPTATVPANAHTGDIAFDAASATITVDGDASDWDGITGVTVELEQIEIPEGVDWDEPGVLEPIDVTLKVATDADNVYMLLEVPDDYDFVADDHNLSASLAVMFLIEPDAGPHMGAGDDDLEAGLGMVDIWHWELDCAAGAALLSGGGDPGSGDDADCNFDDEFATEPEEREDDGGGDVLVNADAENSLTGAWEHTARADGAGAAGTWIFEMSRPLQTGDPQDTQFASGGTTLIALAYFDADETLEGWTDTGHLQSAEIGWIEVTLP